jgi:hypothetical protein
MSLKLNILRAGWPMNHWGVPVVIINYGGWFFMIGCLICCYYAQILHFARFVKNFILVYLRVAWYDQIGLAQH